MIEFITAFWRDETGATSIEYALIGSLVSIAIVGALMEISPALVEKFELVEAAFED